jgi:hypothetical protein
MKNFLLTVDYFKRHNGIFRSKRAVRLFGEQLERLKPHKKISKTGLSWMKETGRFQPLAEEQIAAVIFFYLFSSALPTYIIKFTIYLPFFRVIFCCINPDYHLIRVTSPPN